MKFFTGKYSLLVILTGTAALVHGYTNIDEEVTDQLNTWGGVSLTAWSVDSNANVCLLGVAGERIRGSGEPLLTTGDSRHHIGSVTKSMTASLLAILIHQGYFAPHGWDNTLPTFIPEAMDTAYENVTLRQMVGNNNGIADFPPADTTYPDFDETDLQSFRRAVAVAAVQSTPLYAPGTQYSYSNWAFVTAGHVIEVVTNTSWEKAMAEYLFEPLGIDLGDDSSNYVGPPNNDRDPWGHKHETPCNPSIEDEDCDLPMVMVPAGLFSGPVAAMATYFAWHLACHNGEHTTLLSQEECQEIHQPIDTNLTLPGTGWSYGYGWICTENQEEAGGWLCTHTGSNQFNFYNATLLFEQNRAFVSYTNAASGPQLQHAQMVNTMVGSLIRLADAMASNGDNVTCEDRFESDVYLVNDVSMTPTSAPTDTSTTLDGQSTGSDSAATHFFGSSVPCLVSFALIVVQVLAPITM